MFDDEHLTDIHNHGGDGFALFIAGGIGLIVLVMLTGMWWVS